MAVWRLKRNKANTINISKALGVSEVTSYVLANKGFKARDDFEKYLDAPLSRLYDPFLFLDMDKAYRLVCDAIDKGRKIVIYGDYDVDGIISTTILYRLLSSITKNVGFYIPNREKEGYGLNVEAIKKLSLEGYSLVLTCDNGISAVKEIELAKGLGMEVVILDHHEPIINEEDKGQILPPADAIVDHKRKDCTYPYKCLCAGGISYKFSMLLAKKYKLDTSLLDELLVFASIATVCDVVELLDENRIIVKNGLRLINESIINKGLKALVLASMLKEDCINEHHFGFVIGPSINAMGRLSNAALAVELFTTEDKDRIAYLSNLLVTTNGKRKDMTRSAADEAIHYIENSDLVLDRILVYYNGDIHESIAGIVAGNIKERFYKPTIVITKGQDFAKGSARSIETYNIYEGLSRNRDLFARFGGHPMAAGLSLDYNNIDILRKRLNEETTLTDDDLKRVIRVEKALYFNEIDLDLAYELKNLEPFGAGNLKPLFGSKGVIVERLDIIGKNKNVLKFTFYDEIYEKRLYGISFYGYEDYFKQIKDLYGEEVCCKIQRGEQIKNKIDIVYTIDINKYGFNESVQLVLEDFRLVV